jgi:hypothetical protein
MIHLPTITHITNFKWQVFCFNFFMLQDYGMRVNDLMIIFETIHVTVFITMTPLLKSMSIMVESLCSICSITLSSNNCIMVHCNAQVV